MLARRLDYSPASDEIAMVVSVMHDDLMAHGLRDDDADRVRLAFEALGRRAKRWPRPVDVIEHLPRKPAAAMLEAPHLSSDEVRSNVRALRQAVAGKIITPR